MENCRHSQKNGKPEDKNIQMSILCMSNLIKRCVDSSKVKQRMDSATGTHGRIIGFMYHNRHRDIFQKDIEERFSYRRSTASTVIGLMEEKGLVERYPVSHDARLKKLMLTDKAMELAVLAEEDIERFDRQLRKGISDEQLDVFFSVMEQMKSNLEKQTEISNVN